jgi:tight adherence protein C
MSFMNLDSTTLIIILTSVVVIVGLIVLIVGLSSVNKNKNVVAGRLQDFVLNREKTNSVNFFQRILPREMTGSFFSRTFKPMFQGLVNFFGRYTPGNAVAKLDHSLSIAGNPFGMHAQEFYGIRVLSLFLGIILAFVINYRDHPVKFINLLLGGLIIILFLYLPTVWLNARVRKQKDEYRRNLPDALDMLSVCATAGLGFDQSLRKICDYWPTPLANEFRRANSEMDMGISRGEALRNMSKRLDVDELTSFVAIIVQAESMGMSFAEVLHSQAKQMRILRQFRAKEIANTMPAKMIIPLAVFIFPALIAVILGPIVPTILNLFG